MELNVILLLNSYKTFNANKWADEKKQHFSDHMFWLWGSENMANGTHFQYSHLWEPLWPLMLVDL